MAILVESHLSTTSHDQVFAKSDGGFNWLQLNWLFEDKYNLEPVTSWMLRGRPFRPDMLHSDADPLNGGEPFYWQHGQGSQAKLKKGLVAKIPNEPYDSVGDMGTVRIGPYETISLVRSYRYGTSVTDFHRVLDYFSATEDRSDPEGDGELFSGIARGRVNLNMPPLVRWNSKKAIRATTDGMLPNPYPTIAAMVDVLRKRANNGNRLDADEMPPRIAGNCSGAQLFVTWVPDVHGIRAEELHGDAPRRFGEHENCFGGSVDAEDTVQVVRYGDYATPRSVRRAGAARVVLEVESVRSVHEHAVPFRHAEVRVQSGGEGQFVRAGVAGLQCHF